MGETKKIIDTKNNIAYRLLFLLAVSVCLILLAEINKPYERKSPLAVKKDLEKIFDKPYKLSYGGTLFPAFDILSVSSEEDSADLFQNTGTRIIKVKMKPKEEAGENLPDSGYHYFLTSGKEYIDLEPKSNIIYTDLNHDKKEEVCFIRDGLTSGLCTYLISVLDCSTEKVTEKYRYMIQELAPGTPHVEANGEKITISILSDTDDTEQTQSLQDEGSITRNNNNEIEENKTLPSLQITINSDGSAQGVRSDGETFSYENIPQEIYDVIPDAEDFGPKDLAFMRYHL